MRAFARGNRPIITSDNKGLKAWRDLVALVAQEHAPESIFQGAVTLYATFYLPRPKSLGRKTPPHTKKPDLSKLLRAIEDSLTGVVWRDDSQIVCARVYKSYGYEPGVEIRVEEV